MMNLLQVGLRTKQILGTINTICKKCDKVETTKFYDDDTGSLPAGSFTKRCGCGTWVYKFHNVNEKPDPQNPVSYYTKAFVSAQVFDKDYKNKDSFEREGFKKVNGKYVKG